MTLFPVSFEQTTKRNGSEALLWLLAVVLSGAAAFGLYKVAYAPFIVQPGDPLALPRALTAASRDGIVPLPPELATQVAAGSASPDVNASALTTDPITGAAIAIPRSDASAATNNAVPVSPPASGASAASAPATPGQSPAPGQAPVPGNQAPAPQPGNQAPAPTPAPASSTPPATQSPSTTQAPKSPPTTAAPSPSPVVTLPLGLGGVRGEDDDDDKEERKNNRKDRGDRE